MSDSVLDLSGRGNGVLNDLATNSQTQTLRRLILSHNGISAPDPPFRLHLPLLLHIELEDNQLHHLDFLVECLNLEHISAARNIIEHVFLAPQPPPWTNLLHLDLTNNHLTSLEDVRTLPHLRVLLVANNNLSDLPLVTGQLAELKTLEVLDMRGNPITADFYPDSPVNQASTDGPVSSSLTEYDTLHNLQPAESPELQQRNYYRSFVLYHFMATMRQLDHIATSEEELAQARAYVGSYIAADEAGAGEGVEPSTAGLVEGGSAEESSYSSSYSSATTPTQRTPERGLPLVEQEARHPDVSLGASTPLTPEEPPREPVAATPPQGGPGVAAAPFSASRPPPTMSAFISPTPSSPRPGEPATPTSPHLHQEDATASPPDVFLIRTTEAVPLVAQGPSDAVIIALPPMDTPPAVATTTVSAAVTTTPSGTAGGGATTTPPSSQGSSGSSRTTAVADQQQQGPVPPTATPLAPAPAPAFAPAPAPAPASTGAEERVFTESPSPSHPGAVILTPSHQAGELSPLAPPPPPSAQPPTPSLPVPPATALQVSGSVSSSFLSESSSFESPAALPPAPLAAAPSPTVTAATGLRPAGPSPFPPAGVVALGSPYRPTVGSPLGGSPGTSRSARSAHRHPRNLAGSGSLLSVDGDGGEISYDSYESEEVVVTGGTPGSLLQTSMGDRVALRESPLPTAGTTAMAPPPPPSVIPHHGPHPLVLAAPLPPPSPTSSEPVIMPLPQPPPEAPVGPLATPSPLASIAASPLMVAPPSVPLQFPSPTGVLSTPLPPAAQSTPVVRLSPASPLAVPPAPTTNPSPVLAAPSPPAPIPSAPSPAVSVSSAPSLVTPTGTATLVRTPPLPAGGSTPPLAAAPSLAAPESVSVVRTPSTASSPSFASSPATSVTPPAPVAALVHSVTPSPSPSHARAPFAASPHPAESLGAAASPSPAQPHPSPPASFGDEDSAAAPPAPTPAPGRHAHLALHRFAQRRQTLAAHAARPPARLRLPPAPLGGPARQRSPVRPASAMAATAGRQGLVSPPHSASAAAIVSPHTAAVPTATPGPGSPSRGAAMPAPSSPFLRLPGTDVTPPAPGRHLSPTGRPTSAMTAPVASPFGRLPSPVRPASAAAASSSHSPHRPLAAPSLDTEGPRPRSRSPRRPSPPRNMEPAGPVSYSIVASNPAQRPPSPKRQASPPRPAAPSGPLPLVVSPQTPASAASLTPPRVRSSPAAGTRRRPARPLCASSVPSTPTPSSRDPAGSPAAAASARPSPSASPATSRHGSAAAATGSGGAVSPRRQPSPPRPLSPQLGSATPAAPHPRHPASPPAHTGPPPIAPAPSSGAGFLMQTAPPAPLSPHATRVAAPRPVAPTPGMPSLEHMSPPPASPSFSRRLGGSGGAAPAGSPLKGRVVTFASPSPGSPAESASPQRARVVLSQSPPTPPPAGPLPPPGGFPEEQQEGGGPGSPMRRRMVLSRSGSSPAPAPRPLSPAHPSSPTVEGPAAPEVHSVGPGSPLRRRAGPLSHPSPQLAAASPVPAALRALQEHHTPLSHRSPQPNPAVSFDTTAAAGVGAPLQPAARPASPPHPSVAPTPGLPMAVGTAGPVVIPVELPSPARSTASSRSGASAASRGSLAVLVAALFPWPDPVARGPPPALGRAEWPVISRAERAPGPVPATTTTAPALLSPRRSQPPPLVPAVPATPASPVAPMVPPAAPPAPPSPGTERRRAATEQRWEAHLAYIQSRMPETAAGRAVPAPPSPADALTPLPPSLFHDPLFRNTAAATTEERRLARQQMPPTMPPMYPYGIAPPQGVLLASPFGRGEALPAQDAGRGGEGVLARWAAEMQSLAEWQHGQQHWCLQKWAEQLPVLRLSSHIALRHPVLSLRTIPLSVVVLVGAQERQLTAATQSLPRVVWVDPPTHPSPRPTSPIHSPRPPRPMSPSHSRAVAASGGTTPVSFTRGIAPASAGSDFTRPASPPRSSGPARSVGGAAVGVAPVSPVGQSPPRGSEQHTYLEMGNRTQVSMSPYLQLAHTSPAAAAAVSALSGGSLSVSQSPVFFFKSAPGSGGPPPATAAGGRPAGGMGGVPTPPAARIPGSPPHVPRAPRPASPSGGSQFEEEAEPDGYAVEPIPDIPEDMAPLEAAARMQLRGGWGLRSALQGAPSPPRSPPGRRPADARAEPAMAGPGSPEQPRRASPPSSGGPFQGGVVSSGGPAGSLEWLEEQARLEQRQAALLEEQLALHRRQRDLLMRQVTQATAATAAPPFPAPPVASPQHPDGMPSPGRQPLAPALRPAAGSPEAGAIAPGAPSAAAATASPLPAPPVQQPTASSSTSLGELRPTTPASPGRPTTTSTSTGTLPSASLQPIITSAPAMPLPSPRHAASDESLGGGAARRPGSPVRGCPAPSGGSVAVGVNVPSPQAQRLRPPSSPPPARSPGSFSPGPPRPSPLGRPPEPLPPPRPEPVELGPDEEVAPQRGGLAWDLTGVVCTKEPQPPMDSLEEALAHRRARAQLARRFPGSITSPTRSPPRGGPARPREQSTSPMQKFLFTDADGVQYTINKEVTPSPPRRKALPPTPASRSPSRRHPPVDGDWGADEPRGFYDGFSAENPRPTPATKGSAWWVGGPAAAAAAAGSSPPRGPVRSRTPPRRADAWTISTSGLGRSRPSGSSGGRGGGGGAFIGGGLPSFRPSSRPRVTPARSRSRSPSAAGPRPSGSPGRRPAASRVPPAAASVPSVPRRRSPLRVAHAAPMAVKAGGAVGAAPSQRVDRAVSRLLGQLRTVKRRTPGRLHSYPPRGTLPPTPEDADTTTSAPTDSYDTSALVASGDLTATSAARRSPSPPPEAPSRAQWAQMHPMPRPEPPSSRAREPLPRPLSPSAPVSSRPPPPSSPPRSFRRPPDEAAELRPWATSRPDEAAPPPRREAPAPPQQRVPAPARAAGLPSGGEWDAPGALSGPLVSSSQLMAAGAVPSGPPSSFPFGSSALLPVHGPLPDKRPVPTTATVPTQTTPALASHRPHRRPSTATTATTTTTASSVTPATSDHHRRHHRPHHHSPPPLPSPASPRSPPSTPSTWSSSDSQEATPRVAVGTVTTPSLGAPAFPQVTQAHGAAPIGRGYRPPAGPLGAPSQPAPPSYQPYQPYQPPYQPLRAGAPGGGAAPSQWYTLPPPPIEEQFASAAPASPPTPPPAPVPSARGYVAVRPAATTSTEQPQQPSPAQQPVPRPAPDTPVVLPVGLPPSPPSAASQRSSGASSPLLGLESPPSQHPLTTTAPTTTITTTTTATATQPTSRTGTTTATGTGASGTSTGTGTASGPSSSAVSEPPPPPPSAPEPALQLYLVSSHPGDEPPLAGAPPATLGQALRQPPPPGSMAIPGTGLVAVPVRGAERMLDSAASVVPLGTLSAAPDVAASTGLPSGLLSQAAAAALRAGADGVLVNLPPAALPPALTSQGGAAPSPAPAPAPAPPAPAEMPMYPLVLTPRSEVPILRSDLSMEEQAGAGRAGGARAVSAPPGQAPAPVGSGAQQTAALTAAWYPGASGPRQFHRLMTSPAPPRTSSAAEGMAVTSADGSPGASSGAQSAPSPGGSSSSSSSYVSYAPPPPAAAPAGRRVVVSVPPQMQGPAALVRGTSPPREPEPAMPELGAAPSVGVSVSVPMGPPAPRQAAAPVLPPPAALTSPPPWSTAGSPASSAVSLTPPRFPTDVAPPGSVRPVARLPDGAAASERVSSGTSTSNSSFSSERGPPQGWGATPGLVPAIVERVATPVSAPRKDLAAKLIGLSAIPPSPSPDSPGAAEAALTGRLYKDLPPESPEFRLCQQIVEEEENYATLPRGYACTRVLKIFDSYQQLTFQQVATAERGLFFYADTVPNLGAIVSQGFPRTAPLTLVSRLAAADQVCIATSDPDRPVIVRKEWRVLLCVAKAGRTLRLPLDHYQQLIRPAPGAPTLAGFVAEAQQSGAYDSISVVSPQHPHAQFVILFDQRRCLAAYLVEYKLHVHPEEGHPHPGGAPAATAATTTATTTAGPAEATATVAPSAPALATEAPPAS
ncbi:hypothetical protein PAPYR_1307 [Paratrimastix pyriformis]|uniref:Leucine-rich repeat-containing protein n=1 Tax=Paratrimastix pyriformis TaxID=342808 RepID=A0ABQ8UTG1_9EUKA|nr:hypothetical protein PAPYR_1307 [Paratrimastix pyriformis]